MKHYNLINLNEIIDTSYVLSICDITGDRRTPARSQSFEVKNTNTKILMLRSPLDRLKTFSSLEFFKCEILSPAFICDV